jgi:thermitase
MKKTIGFLALLIFSSANAELTFKRKYVEGEIIVKYTTNVSTEMQKNFIEREGGKRLRKLNSRGFNQVKIDRKKNIKDVIAEYQSDPNVEYAQPNYIYRIKTVPNDTYYGQQWGLKNTAQKIVTRNGPDAPSSTNNPGTAGKDMDLENAWNTITNCSSVTVAVLDTGINYNHEDLSANMWNGGVTYPKHGYDFVGSSDDDPMDENGHGTHVAGTIGAVGNNGKGTTGVCWNVKLMGVRVLDATGSGTTASIVQGIDFAVARGAKVLNMSLGGENFDAAYSTAITNARTSGAIVVAAAGNESANNDSGTTPSYPCNFSHDNVVCVAALDQNFSLASFSNYGTTSVDISAPGVNITSSWPGTHTTISDALNSGWTFTSTTTKGWGYKNLLFSTGTASTLANPSNWDGLTKTYDPNTDSKAWKQFNLTGKNVAIVNFYLMLDLDLNDQLNFNVRTDGGDPFLGGDQQDSVSGNSDDKYKLMSYDITPYLSSSMSMGFNLLSDSTDQRTGADIAFFDIQTLTYNTFTYNVSNGTSMASPHVAGLAAMLFAFNPNYTYSDVVTAIKQGGLSNPDLAFKTESGKAASATGSLNYINAPTGGAAVKLP